MNSTESRPESTSGIIYMIWLCDLKLIACIIVKPLQEKSPFFLGQKHLSSLKQSSQRTRLSYNGMNIFHEYI